MKIAIDPGWSGAVAFEIDGKTWTVNCPDTQFEMFDILNSVKNGMEDNTVSAIIEKVHSMPAQGVKSVWSFSANYASWQMALIALKIPFKEVPPQKWMKALGNLPADKKLRKNCIKDQMQKKYPHIKVTLANADALGILSMWGKL